MYLLWWLDSSYDEYVFIRSSGTRILLRDLLNGLSHEAFHELLEVSDL